MSNQPGMTMTYDDAVMAANVAQTAREEQQKGILDRQYYRGIPAILKAVEVVLSLIAYICIAVLWVYCSSSTDGFFKFVTMGSFTATLVLWAVLLLKVPQRILRCNCVNWIFVEFVFYAVTLIFYFFADLFQSIHACTSGHKAAVAFGWFVVVPYSIDFFFAIRKFKEQRSATREAARAAENPQVTVDNKY